MYSFCGVTQAGYCKRTKLPNFDSEVVTAAFVVLEICLFSVDLEHKWLTIWLIEWSLFFFNHFNHLNFKTVIKKGAFDLNLNHMKVRYVVNNSITE